MSSDNDTFRPLEEQANPADREKMSVIKTWGGEVNARAEVRRVKVQNQLGEELVRYTNLRTELARAEQALAESQEWNNNIDLIKAKAVEQVKAELQEAKNRLQNLDVEKQKLDAETNEILGRHHANKAEEEARKKRAEASKLQAESDALDAQIAIELKKKKLAQVRSNPDDILHGYMKERQEKATKLAALEEEYQNLLDPVLDDDETQPVKLKAVERQINQLKAEIAELDAKIEELS